MLEYCSILGECKGSISAHTVRAKPGELLREMFLTEPRKACLLSFGYKTVGCNFLMNSLICTFEMLKPTYGFASET